MTHGRQPPTLHPACERVYVEKAVGYCARKVHTAANEWRPITPANIEMMGRLTWANSIFFPDRVATFQRAAPSLERQVVKFEGVGFENTFTCRVVVTT